MVTHSAAKKPPLHLPATLLSPPSDAPFSVSRTAQAIQNRQENTSPEVIIQPASARITEEAQTAGAEPLLRSLVIKPGRSVWMTTLIWTITAIPYRSITIIKACELDQPIKALPIITAGSARCVISEKLMTIIWSCVGLCLQEPGQTAAIIGIIVTRHPWFKMASCQAENPFVQGFWPRRERE